MQPATISITVILAALIAAIAWNLLTWWLGIPSSSSHALIGGILGAVIVSAGLGAIQLAGIEKVLLALFFSPLIGLLGGYLFTRLVFFLARGATPHINWFFKRSQIVSALGLAFSHGTNDAQKTMGVITLGLVSSGALESFLVPLWVVAPALRRLPWARALGGWRLIRTLGGKFYKIQPVHGFCAQSTSALVILGASLLGGPVSTTHVVSTAIMGVGAADRLNKVRWGVAGEIVGRLAGHHPGDGAAGGRGVLGDRAIHVGRTFSQRGWLLADNDAASGRERLGSAKFLSHFFLLQFDI